jgi:hypothetical protein
MHSVTPNSAGLRRSICFSLHFTAADAERSVSDATAKRAPCQSMSEHCSHTVRACVASFALPLRG